MITSAHNPKIQWVRKLQTQSRQRRESNAFIVEGVRLAEEALHAKWDCLLLLYTTAVNARGLSVVQGLIAHGAPAEQVSPEVLRVASDTQTPQGILAVFGQKTLPLPVQPDFLLIPDGMRDPGNLGAILRTAAAAGTQAVLLPPGSVDPFAPKVVRSAMGAHFRLPIHLLSWEEIRQIVNPVNGRQLQVYLADPVGGSAYSQTDLRRPLALLIGGEAAGASPQTASLAPERIHIPMPGKMESLNAAAATAVLLFAVVEQRTQEK